MSFGGCGRGRTHLLWCIRKKGSKSYARYRTIGWKANLYLNGAYQESVYFSLNGEYVKYISNVTVGDVEYILFYIKTDDLRTRFHNQNAINNGNHGGEVYDTYDGIANTRSWSNATKKDLYSNFNKVPTGMYFSISVSGGSVILSTSGGGKYIYGVRASKRRHRSRGVEVSKTLFYIQNDYPYKYKIVKYIEKTPFCGSI